jgi:hypothetical protein
MRPVRPGVEPQPLVRERRLRPQQRVGEGEDAALLQPEGLDLVALEAVEDLVEASVRDHRPQPFLGAGGEAAALVRLREPEVHGQRVVDDEVLLDLQVGQGLVPLRVLVEDLDGGAREDVEPLVHEHLEEAVVARSRHHGEAVRLQDLDVDPAEPEAEAQAPEVLHRAHGVDPRLIPLADEQDAVAAEVLVDGDADGWRS